MAECPDHSLSPNTPQEEEVDCIDTSQSATKSSAPDDNTAELQEKHDSADIGQAAGHGIGDQTNLRSIRGEATIGEGEDTCTLTEPANTISSKQQKSSPRVVSMYQRLAIPPQAPTEPNTVRNITIDMLILHLKFMKQMKSQL